MRIGQLRQPTPEPLSVFNIDVVQDAAIFSAKVQHDAIAFDLLEKVRLCEIDRIVAAACYAPENRNRARVSKRSAEIADYVASGEPMDKAGAYAIQGLGSRFITRISGSYSNVVGLPVSVVYQLCTNAGLLIS